MLQAGFGAVWVQLRIGLWSIPKIFLWSNTRRNREVRRGWTEAYFRTTAIDATTVHAHIRFLTTHFTLSCTLQFWCNEYSPDISQMLKSLRRESLVELASSLTACISQTVNRKSQKFRVTKGRLCILLMQVILLSSPLGYVGIFQWTRVWFTCILHFIFSWARWK